MYTFHHARPLFLTFALAGYAYGGLWAIAPTMLSEIFGLTNFGKVYGLVTTAPAIASLVFNGVASIVYEAHVEGDDSKSCYGSDCFWGSLIFGASVCLVVSVGSFLRYWQKMRHVHPQ
jgi:MFS family permease